MYNQVDTLSLSKSRPASTSIKVLYGWLIIFVALGFSGWVGEFAEKNWEFVGRSRYGLQAALMAGIVLFGIWMLRKQLDRGTPKLIGIDGVIPALKKFGFGTALIIIPLLIVILVSTLFGWSEVTFNTSATILQSVMVSMITIFFFEALPEELVFRGYIFSNLNMSAKKWQAALLTVALFVLLPVVLVFVQRTVLGMNISVGASGTLTYSYLITMFFFASFTIYLRILTNSIWTGVGFHMFFVGINRLIGSGENSTRLIQFNNVNNEAPMQIVLIVSLLLIFIGLLLYPIITKNKLGWKEISPE